MITIEHHAEESRILAFDEAKQIGVLTYAKLPNKWVANYTLVDPNYRGQNIGASLVEELVAQAKLAEVKIQPTCSYIKKQFAQNEGYQDIQV